MSSDSDLVWTTEPEEDFYDEEDWDDYGSLSCGCCSCCGCMCYDWEDEFEVDEL